MNMGKKQIYALILGLAIIGLAVDKFLLSASVTNPDDAYGATDSIPLSSRIQDGASVKGTAGTPIPELPFPRALPPFDPVIDHRDLFAIPKPVMDRLMQSHLGDITDQANAVETRRSTTTAKEFRSRHHLSAVISYADKKLAIVDSEWLYVGDELDDCTLVDITVSSRKVVFECDDGPVTLEAFPITDAITEVNDGS